LQIERLISNKYQTKPFFNFLTDSLRKEMDKHIIKVFDLEANPNDITPIDWFKLFHDFDAFVSTLKDYASKNHLTNVEQFYFDLETDPRRKFFYRLSQTYYHNYFLRIHFILSNPILLNKPTFANLYKDKHLLPKITDHIIDLYENIDPNAEKFFNKHILDKFVNNLDFEPLPDELTNEEYRIYFQLFVKETSRLKAFLIEYVKQPKWAEHPEQGLSEFAPEYYQYIFEYHTGLKLNSPTDFLQIKKWGQKHLNYLLDEINRTCDRLLLNDEDKQRSVFDKMIIVGKHHTQFWSSKQEMIDAHETAIQKYRRIFVDQYQFKEFIAPNIVILDNPLLAGGYYDKGNFYLNVCHWATGNHKYSVETLTLHEAIPGHHLQLDISYHSPNNNYFTAIEFSPCNGFIEGWALFAEHLGDAMNNDPWIYFGYLQSNIFRTFRVIAEISLHVEGQTPEQVIQLAKQYLTFNEAIITQEVNRYRIMPGQACSYKIGLEVFKQVLKQKFHITDFNDLLRPELIQWYKELLWQTERPLDVFLKENGVTWSFDD